MIHLQHINITNNLNMCRMEKNMKININHTVNDRLCNINHTANNI